MKEEIILRQHTDYPCRPNDKFDCGVCGKGGEPVGTLVASLDGSSEWVCDSCLDRHWKFAGLSKMIDVFNHILFWANREDADGASIDESFKQLRQLIDESRRHGRRWPHHEDVTGDTICPRCGVHEQATHHPLCQYRDGTPTPLPDKVVAALIKRQKDDCVGDKGGCMADCKACAPIRDVMRALKREQQYY